MTWILEGEIEAPSRISARGKLAEEADFPSALRASFTSKLQVSTIGAQALNWRGRRYDSSRRAAIFRASFNGDISFAEFKAWVRALFGQAPVRGRVQVIERDSEEVWYSAGIRVNGCAFDEYDKPVSRTRDVEDRSGW